MIVYRTKYYGIHTDRIRALAEQIGRGKNLEEKRIMDELYGKSRESMRSLDLNLKDKLKRRGYHDNYKNLLKVFEDSDKAEELITKRNELWNDPQHVEFYEKIGNKVNKDLGKDELKRILKTRRSPLNYFRDKKITKEIEESVKKDNIGGIKEIRNDGIKEIVDHAKNPVFKEPVALPGTSYFYPDSKTIRKGIGKHNRPEVLGHEVDHAVFRHEDAGDEGRKEILSKLEKEKLKDRGKFLGKELYAKPDKIQSIIKTVQNELNTADRGRVMRPYLSSKSATRSDLDRYSRNKTNYHKALQDYIPPSLDYHTDPATIKKIKEHVEEQQAIDNYLNTDRKWL
jgi:hypothetical protein